MCCRSTYWLQVNSNWTRVHSAVKKSHGPEVCGSLVLQVVRLGWFMAVTATVMRTWFCPALTSSPFFSPSSLKWSEFWPCVIVFLILIFDGEQPPFEVFNSARGRAILLSKKNKFSWQTSLDYRRFKHSLLKLTKYVTTCCEEKGNTPYIFIYVSEQPRSPWTFYQCLLSEMISISLHLWNSVTFRSH